MEKSVYIAQKLTRFMRKNCQPLSPQILTVVLAFFTLFLSSQVFGQAGDLSQIRNGDGKVKNGVLDACGDCWVNGNAGASNAHYTEGMSIAYRSLLTGLTAGVCYEYELGYDTYHGAMAIDYLTHFQRLQPHGPFGHAAEVINPLIFVSGSTKYTMGVVANGTNTFPIKTPAPSGITSGAFNKDGTPRDISNQAATSFNALPAAQRLMTIYNGEIQDFNYVSQAAIVIGGADAETRVRIRFKALSDSVVLAWGGHIASRLDWGYTKKQGNLVPLSAAGISGSPYHMRQKAFDRVECNVNPQFPSTLLQAFSGFGNQDRSLSAAAVFPPPECPTVTSKTQCYENNSFSFSIASPEAGVTYTWSFGSNTVGATFQGGGATAQGSSVTVIANPGADVQGVDNGGSFSLDISADLNGVIQECPGVATGTVVDVDVAASATPSAVNLAVGNTSQLAVSSVTPPYPFVSGNLALYSYQWSQSPASGGSLSSSSIYNPVFTATEAGTYTFKVIATQIAAPNCKDSATVQVVVTAQTPPCGISGPDPVCPGSTNVYKYDTNGDGTAESIPTNFTALWKIVNGNGATISGATNGNTVSVIAGPTCNLTYTVRVVLTSTSGLIKDSCQKTVSVNITNLPTITCPADVNTECSSGIPAPPADQAALKTFFQNAGGSFTGECGPILSYNDQTSAQNCYTVIKRTWTITDGCGNTASCSQIIKVVDRTAPVVTGGCNANPAPIACGSSVIPVPAVTDNCGGSVASFFKDNYPGNAANRQPFIRTWTFVDASGNSTTCVQNITYASPCNGGITTAKTPEQEVVNEVEAKATKQAPVTRRIPVQQIKDLSIKAFPNPYFSAVNFQVVSPVSGNASLEVYDLMGRRLDVVYQGYVDAGMEKTINYRISQQNRVPLIYKLTVGDQSTRGKLLPDKGFEPEP